MKKDFFFIVFSFVFFGCGEQTEVEAQADKNATTELKEVVAPVIKRVLVKDLSPAQIKSFSIRNPCYLPLLRDSNLYLEGTPIGFSYKELFNLKLPQNHTYKNRYLVGQFNSLDDNFNSKGLIEVNPEINNLLEFKSLDPQIALFLDKAVYEKEYLDSLKKLLTSKYPTRVKEILNFYDKVWKYKTPPLNRNFGFANGAVYATGQEICMCEAFEDTLILNGSFGISGKRLDPRIYVDEAGVSHKSMVEYLPIKRGRKYYAGKYSITSKNWESQRKYDSLDIKHDQDVGGGNERVTYYKGKAQLPNFLLMYPSDEYPDAMHSNGIHECALVEMSMGLLGTPNSIGCIRVTDFGSKILRWWTPQDCNFFIIYSEDKYYKKYVDKNFEDFIPFKNNLEGDHFRKWLNDYYPFQAKQLNIDSEGDYKNGHVIDAYNLYEADYKKFKSSSDGTKK